MIYVITPYLVDVVKTCHKEGFECRVMGGRLMNPNILWIHDWMQLMGRKIFNHDKILWGEGAKDFDPKQYNRIYEEIELRKRG